MKKSSRYDLIVVIPSIILALICVFIVFIGNYKMLDNKNYDEANKKFREKYDTKLKEIGFKREDDTYYYGDHLRLTTILNYENNLQIDLRDSLIDYEYKDKLDIYLKTINLFMDMDYDTLTRGFDFFEKNIKETDVTCYYNLQYNEFEFEVSYYPGGNLVISIIPSKREEIYYRFYNNKVFDDVSFHRYMISKYLRYDISEELLSRLVIEGKKNSTYENYIYGSFNYEDIDIGLTVKPNDYDISARKYSERLFNLSYKIPHKYDEYKEELEKDLLIFDKYFNENSIQYKEKIINYIESDSSDLKRYESNSGSYYYGNLYLDGNFHVFMRIYEDRIEFEYSFKE